MEPAPSKRILDDVHESAAAPCARLADLWRSARTEIKTAKADAAGWKILADRALAGLPMPGEVKAEIAHASTRRCTARRHGTALTRWPRSAGAN